MKKIVDIPGRPDLRGVVNMDHWLTPWLKIQRKGRIFWSTIADAPLHDVPDPIQHAVDWCLNGGREAYKAREKARLQRQRQSLLERL